MKFEIRTLLSMTLVIGSILAGWCYHYRPVRLTYGMTTNQVKTELKRLNAQDAGCNPSVAYQHWIIPDQDFRLETIIKNDKLWKIRIQRNPGWPDLEAHQITVPMFGKPFTHVDWDFGE